MDRSVWPSIRKWTRGAFGLKPPTVVLQCECLRHHYLAGWVEVLEVLEMICIEPVEPIPGCRTIEGVDPHCGYGGSMTNVFTPRLRLVHAQTQHKPTIEHLTSLAQSGPTCHKPPSSVPIPFITGTWAHKHEVVWVSASVYPVTQMGILEILLLSSSHRSC